MRPVRTFAAALLLLAASSARADFVVDNTTLPTTKSDIVPVPSGADPTKRFQAADYNALMNAAVDLRTSVVNGRYHGLAARSADPAPTNATNYFWLKSNNQLHFVLPGPTDGLVVYGSATTKGDLLVFGGTTFSRVAVGSNGQVLTADSTQTGGVKWAAAGGAPEVIWDPVDGAAQSVGSPAFAGGNFTTGSRFHFTTACTITGYRLYYSDTTSRSIKVTLWDHTNGSAATKTVTYSTVGVKSESFSSPVSVSAAGTFQPWTLGMRDTSGSAYLSASWSALSPPQAAEGSRFVDGGHFVSHGWTFFHAGDARPDTLDTGVIYPLTPVFTCP